MISISAFFQQSVFYTTHPHDLKMIGCANYSLGTIKFWEVKG